MRDIFNQNRFKINKTDHLNFDWQKRRGMIYNGEVKTRDLTAQISLKFVIFFFFHQFINSTATNQAPIILKYNELEQFSINILNIPISWQTCFLVNLILTPSRYGA